MRAAEALNFLFFLSFTGLAWLRSLAPDRRRRASWLGLAGLSLTALGLVCGRLLPPEGAAILRDWLPAPLMLVAYWQAGQFFTAPDRKLQRLLEDLDRRWLGAARFPSGQGRVLGSYLELAYLFCYPMVPLGLASLYAAGLASRAAEFWAIVVPASYLCYAMVPVFQTLPPRLQEAAGGAEGGALRAWNLRILHRASIQANTFPSAHVAASLAASLAVLRHLVPAGVILLAISLSIAAAAVLRRYHYALDVLVGALVALSSYLLARAWLG